MKLCGIVLILISLASGANEDAPTLNVDEWLRGPERQDFSWTVEVSKPRLTLQQRFLVRVHASINVNDLGDRALRHSVHFIVKIADAEKRWVPGQFHRADTMPPGTGNLAPLSFDAGIYLRPGSYTIATIAYDAALNQGNLRLQDLKVSGSRRDPLPELDRDLPNVEFIPEIPGPALMDVYEWNPFFMDAGWQLGGGKEWLPVKNRRNLCIDIVVNTAVNPDTEQHRLSPWAYNYRMNASQMMQVASVLSHLALRAGSVRVTVLDALRMKMIFDREDAGNFDWQHASKVVEDQDQATIDIGLLGLQKKTPGYLFDVFREISTEAGGANAAGPPLKVVVVVSRELWFDEEARVQPFVAQDSAATKYFYFCVTEHEYVNDDIFKMLKPNKPRCIFLLDPLYFRKALASLIASLEKY